jgi:TPR repeat protein
VPQQAEQPAPGAAAAAPRSAAPVVACAPPQLQAAQRSRAKDVGNVDPAVQAAYVRAVTLLYCEAGQEEQGTRLLKETAKAGYRPSIRLLASRLADDPSVLGEEAAAFYQVFLKEAAAGAASAANVAAAMADQGIGTPVDHRKALQLLRSAAADGSQRGIEQLLYALATGRGGVIDTAGARKLLTRLEQVRAVRTLPRVIVALELGREGRRDPAAAAEWRRIAGTIDKNADKAVAVALEKAWSNGGERLASRDILAAAKRYGSLEAVYRDALGKLAGPAQQKAEAVNELRSVAIQGHAGASQALAALLAESGSLGESGSEASEALREVLNSGNAQAMLSVANQIYFADTSMPKLWLAARYVRQAAEIGLPEAQHRLGLLYADGLGVPKDQREAVLWLSKAKSSGYPLAGIALEALQN